MSIYCDFCVFKCTEETKTIRHVRSHTDRKSYYLFCICNLHNMTKKYGPEIFKITIELKCNIEGP